MPVQLDEHLLTLAEAAKYLPPVRRGRRIHVSTLYRWISRGVGGVCLESTKLGGTVFTSKEALQRFADRQSGEPGRSRPAPAPRAASRSAEAELVRRGF
jgi:uncharacterized protein DUF1580